MQKEHSSITAVLLYCCTTAVLLCSVGSSRALGLTLHPLSSPHAPCPVPPSTGSADISRLHQPIFPSQPKLITRPPTRNSQRQTQFLQIGWHCLAGFTGFASHTPPLGPFFLLFLTTLRCFNRRHRVTYTTPESSDTPSSISSTSSYLPVSYETWVAGS